MRHIRISNDGHRMLAKLSNDMGVSMSAVCDLALKAYSLRAKPKVKTDPRYTKVNRRTVV